MRNALISFIALLIVTAAFIGSNMYSMKVGADGVKKTVIEMKVINNGCWVPSVKWEGEA